MLKKIYYCRTKKSKLIFCPYLIVIHHNNRTFDTPQIGNYQNGNQLEYRTIWIQNNLKYQYKLLIYGINNGRIIPKSLPSIYKNLV